MKLVKENFEKALDRERRIANFRFGMIEKLNKDKKETEFDKNDSVKKWYEETFPEDATSVEDVDPNITFVMAATYITPKGYEDRFYNKMNIHDSVVRERIFEKIAKLYGLSYDDIYETWMGKPFTRLKDALMKDGVKYDLGESALTGGNDKNNIYWVTYKASDTIFSSFMIEAKNKEEAQDKAIEFRKIRYDANTDIIETHEMTPEEVKDYQRRGMSLVTDKTIENAKKDAKSNNENNGQVKEDIKEDFIPVEINGVDLSGDNGFKGTDLELNIDTEKTEEVPASPQTNDKIMLANALNALIQDEWQAIDGYNNTIATLRELIKEPNSIGEDTISGMIKVLEDINAEENNHIGMLQKSMSIISPNVTEIKGGEEEATKTIDNTASID